MESQTFGRYEIRAEIGRGGMARVYRAYDPRFKREVAIKVLPPELLENPTFRARFEREAQAIAALEHPAIVPVHDVGEENGQPYIVMRLMNGGSLADRLVDGPLKLTEVSRILNHLAPALDKAHAAGIVHRDLKPANVLFDEEDHPYIADFGLARLAEPEATLTVTGIYGTPAYMSPEQARGEAEVDGRSDVYSLGAMLFQLLSGRLPFEATTPIGLALRHVTDVPPRLTHLRPDLPAACDSIILRAMAKDRDKRFATADELKRAVDAVATAAPLPEWIATTPVDALESAAGSMALATLHADGPLPPATGRAPEVSIAMPGRGVRRVGWPWLALGLITLIAVGLGLGALLTSRLQPTPTPVPTQQAAPTLDTRAVQATVTAAIAPFTRERFEDIERSVLLPRAEGRAEELLTAARVVDAQGQVLRYDLLVVDALRGEALWRAPLSASPEAIRLLQFDANHLAWTDGATVSVHLRQDASTVWSDLQLVRLDNCPGNSCFRVRNGAVLVVDPDRELLARELTTGDVRWTYTLGGARVLGDLGGELVIVRDRGSETFGLDLVSVTTGAVREFSPTCELERQTLSVGRNNLTLSPVGDVYYLVFAGEPACVQSYDLNTNALNWSQPVTDYGGSLRAEADGAYVNTGNGVVRFDQQTGQATTLTDTGGRVMFDVVGDMLLMRDEDAGERGLAVVETSSGLTRWSRVLDGQPLEGGGAVAAFSRLSLGQSVWVARYTEAGWLLMTYQVVAADRAELQVERLAWADGTSETLFSLPITPPSGEVTAPNLLAQRDSSYWWVFDDRYILRLDLAEQSLTPVWPP